MANDRTPPKPETPDHGKAAGREAKLAAALRANLRRRKAQPAGGETRKPQDGESA